MYKLNADDRPSAKHGEANSRQDGEDNTPPREPSAPNVKEAGITPCFVSTSGNRKVDYLPVW